MRTFIALKLPSDFITSISQIERDLSTSIRGNFVPENSLHLTLAFMGELKTNAQVSATQAALELATRNFAPISLHPEGLGYIWPLFRCNALDGHFPHSSTYAFSEEHSNRINYKGAALRPSTVQAAYHSCSACPCGTPANKRLSDARHSPSN